jgi:hypothetical protein
MIKFARQYLYGSTAIKRDYGKGRRDLKKVGSSGILVGCETKTRSANDEPTRDILP